MIEMESPLGDRNSWAPFLFVTAVAAERDAIIDGVRAAAPAVPGRVSNPAAGDQAAITIGPVTAAIVGVGPAAAAGTARLLALAEAAGSPFRGVCCAGIAGGFPGRVEIGGLALATACVAADLGAEDGERFLPLDELGFGPVTAAADPALLRRIAAELPSAVTGPILTVTTATGGDHRAAELLRGHPDAIAEAMEGFGVATAATAVGVPCCELRGISNQVGRRDLAAWRIPAALGALRDAGAALGALVAADRG